MLNSNIFEGELFYCKQLFLILAPGAGKEKLAEIEKIKDLGVTVITDLNELERLLK